MMIIAKRQRRKKMRESTRRIKEQLKVGDKVVAHFTKHGRSPHFIGTVAEIEVHKDVTAVALRVITNLEKGGDMNIDHAIEYQYRLLIDIRDVDEIL